MPAWMVSCESVRSVRNRADVMDSMCAAQGVWLGPLEPGDKPAAQLFLEPWSTITSTGHTRALSYSFMVLKRSAHLL